MAKRIVWVGLFPKNGNCVGDHAQIIATRKLLNKYFYDYEIVPFYRRELNDWNRFAEAVEGADYVFIQGGGDFGSFRNEWHLTRKKIVAAFPHKKIVQLPVGVLYDKRNAKIAFEDDRAFFSSDNFLLFCRNPEDYDLFKDNFSCKVAFMPDFVLSLKPSLNAVPRENALVVLRRDEETIFRTWRLDRGVERVMRHSKKLGVCVRKGVTAYHLLHRYLTELKIKRQVLKYVDKVTVKEVQISDRDVGEDREQYVKDLFDYYRSFKVVVTDRFHGMVFSILTGTPCVILPIRFSTKMAGYKSIVPSNVKFVDSIDAVSDAVQEVLKVGDCNAGFSRYYDDFREIILNSFAIKEKQISNSNEENQNILKIITNRRSVRCWTDKPIESEKVEQILQSGIYAPSAMNAQAVRFMVVSDSDRKKFLCSQSSTWFKHNYPSSIVMVFYDVSGKSTYKKYGADFVEFAERFMWQDTACAMQNMMLTSEALGLKTCWASVDKKNTEKICKELGITDQYFLTSMLFIGYSHFNVEEKKNLIHLGKPVQRKPLSTYILHGRCV